MNEIRATWRPIEFTLEGSPPTRVEPVTLAMAKGAIRFDGTAEDDLISGWITAGREQFEALTDRQSIDALWEYALDRFPSFPQIEVPRPPLISVDAVVYDDESGAEQTLDVSRYRVRPSLVLSGSPATGVIDPYCRCGRLELVPDATWPTTINRAEAVRIRFRCGYGASPDQMPASLKSAIYFFVGHFHRNRAEVTAEANLATVPLGASTLLKEFKYRALRQLVPRA